MRPLLTKDMPLDDFLHYYWLKEELQQFVKQVKEEINQKQLPVQ